MKFILKKILPSLFIFGIVFLSYNILFPNDFFLPKIEYIKNNDFFFKQTPTRLTIYDKRKTNEELLKLIENPDLHLNLSSNLFKNNSKRTLGIEIIGSKKYLIKKFNYKNLYDWISKCPFRSSKAYRSWFYAYQLKKMGVMTIEPVAIIEKRIGPFWTKTYLITEYVEAKTLKESLDLNFKQLDVCSKLVDVLNIFYKFRYVHRDFIGQNILVTEDNVCIIDLDEMHTYSFNNSIFRKKFFNKHLTKFLKKIPPESQFSKNFLMTHKNQSEYNCELKNSEKSWKRELELQH